MKYLFCLVAAIIVLAPWVSSAHVLPANLPTILPAAGTSIVQAPESITPSKSPFIFVPLSDFKHFGVETAYKVEGVYPSEEVLYRLKSCESRIYDAYRALPAGHRTQLKYLTFLWTSTAQRGLGGDASIHLKCNDISDEELTSVFVHEIGHIVDTGVLGGHSAAGMSAYLDSRTSVFTDDPSIEFYSVSWRTAKSVYKNSTAFDFVTVYAMSNPFEDFAETYNFYLLHGSQFKYMTRANKRLATKYVYMKTKIFGGREFVNNDFKLNNRRRSYDATLLPFSLANLVKSV